MDSAQRYAGVGRKFEIDVDLDDRLPTTYGPSGRHGGIDTDTANEPFNEPFKKMKRKNR